MFAQGLDLMNFTLIAEHQADEVPQRNLEKQRNLSLYPTQSAACSVGGRVSRAADRCPRRVLSNPTATGTCMLPTVPTIARTGATVPGAVPIACAPTIQWSRVSGSGSSPSAFTSAVDVAI